jgi:hypothetical protein
MLENAMTWMITASNLPETEVLIWSQDKFRVAVLVKPNPEFTSDTSPFFMDAACDDLLDWPDYWHSLPEKPPTLPSLCS